jgi:dTDP-4-amino-4,6-dideoxygalactose transaminase
MKCVETKLNSNKKFIPYAQHDVDEQDIEAVISILRGDYLTTGPTVLAFEKKLAEVTGSNEAISCSSGTAALHLSALALKLGPGDKVIVPSITFLATANAVRFVGAEVIFSDVDPGTGLITAKHFEKSVGDNSDQVKAVVPVHLAGQSPDMRAIASIAKDHGIKIIEDASHALGTTNIRANSTKTRVGDCNDSDITIFSFHPIKSIAAGEGGALTTRSKDLARRILLLRNHGMERTPERFMNRDLAFDASGNVNPWYYEMQEVGYNYRISDINCALGLSQLGKLHSFLDRRRKLADYYDILLKPLASIL